MHVDSSSINITQTSALLLGSAAENIPHADEVRTLVKDIWDLRVAKLRSSVDMFLKSDSTHAKVRPGSRFKMKEIVKLILFLTSCPLLAAQQPHSDGAQLDSTFSHRIHEPNAFTSKSTFTSAQFVPVTSVACLLLLDCRLPRTRYSSILFVQ